MVIRYRPAAAVLPLRACARKRPCGNCGRMTKDETSNIVRQCDRTAAALFVCNRTAVLSSTRISCQRHRRAR
eukprot:5390695-Prymnesium_polylepis.1